MATITYEHINSDDLEAAEMQDLLIIRKGTVDFPSLLLFVKCERERGTRPSTGTELCSCSAGHYLIGLALRQLISVELAIFLFADLAFTLCPDVFEPEAHEEYLNFIGDSKQEFDEYLVLAVRDVVNWIPSFHYLRADFGECISIMKKAVSELNEGLSH